MSILLSISLILTGLVCLKAITIGSGFSIHRYLKYGKRYSKWYNTEMGNFQDRESNLFPNF